MIQIIKTEFLEYLREAKEDIEALIDEIDVGVLSNEALKNISIDVDKIVEWQYGKLEIVERVNPLNQGLKLLEKPESRAEHKCGIKVHGRGGHKW